MAIKKMKVVRLELHATDFAKFHQTCDRLFLSDTDYESWCYRAFFSQQGPRKVFIHLFYDDESKLFRLAQLFGRGQ